jgi:hypothetical protein
MTRIGSQRHKNNQGHVGKSLNFSGPTKVRQQNCSLYCINPLNAELNPICSLLALFGAHHILHVNRIRVKQNFKECNDTSDKTYNVP